MKGKAASVAALVDSQASELLGQVVAAATDGYECDPEKPGPHFDYVTELEHIEIVCRDLIINLFLARTNTSFIEFSFTTGF